MSGAGLTQRRRGPGPSGETAETRLEYDEDYVKAAQAASSIANGSPMEEGYDATLSKGDFKGILSSSRYCG